ncbi:Ornithine cyclodeaminase [Rubrivivax sp. A210]|uniref:ornithine cyclodeaminase family protein n=1 Tax=Rubrivivax sp. A210 TaxID=2772301 RepID=UPI001918A75B|nr:ornithine cyclodeaminase family protein [Rubrivivax sp. A210]CAD5371900.1 Ornithine cyclodeaminase [Rubrivivax sp. A210]
MTRVYTAAEVHAALPWPALAQALEAAFVAGVAQPLRHGHALSAADTLLLMPAWNARLVVVKLVTVMPAAAATVQACVLALDRSTGEALALLDGEAITLRRTAATSALAARHLARGDASRLLIVGSGRLAGWMARAHAALRPALTQIDIWGRKGEAAKALARELAAQGLPTAAAPDLEAAVRAADIVCCATTSTTPLVRGEWLAPGTHLDLVGGFKPGMREVDDAAVQRATIVVDTYAGALAEAGDLTQPLARGAITRAHIVAELAELLRTGQGRRRDASEITLFKSVGAALEDLAAAQLVLGLGLE